MTAVTAVDDGHFGVARGEFRRAVPRMSYHQNIRIAANDADRVGKAFALRGRTRARIGARHRFTAKPKHCAFEGEPGSRAGLVEKTSQDAAGKIVQASRDPVGRFLVAQFFQVRVCEGKYPSDLFCGEVVDRGDVSQIRHGRPL